MDHSFVDEDALALPAAAVLAPDSVDVEKESTSTGLIRSSGWLDALKQVFPIYLATHIAFLALTYLAALFSIPNFSTTTLPLKTLLDSWYRWDSGHYTNIALHGYTGLFQWDFFPLFPLSERALMVVVQDPFVAGLLISNIATLGMFMVLYRLVAEDFDAERGWRTVLYLAVFPTAFFFAAAYNESLFLLFVLLSFYYIRRGRWWLAGLAALFAGLTRSTVVCLCVPFFYEYLRQRNFQWRKIRPDILSALGIIGGFVVMGVYGYIKLHDFLAFSHAEDTWNRHFTVPWFAFRRSLSLIIRHPVLSFVSIHTVMDLSAILFILVALIVAFVGPLKLAREHWSYGLYGVAVFVLILLVPETAGDFPIAAFSRFMLEVFPAFLMLAAMGTRRNFQMYYLAICLPLLAFMLLQWLTGGWIV